jgi:pyruvate formate lyase activating enzyme
MGGIGMQIAGIQKNSLVDYPGKLAFVIFTPYCNMNCYYCHNRIILENNKIPSFYDPDDILRQLKVRRKLIDGVVISGGEPTLQPDLEDYIRELVNLGYPVKLDTNGTRPEVIRPLIDKGLISYIAMDIKAPRERYDEICGTHVNLDDIESSIRITMSGKVDYEFRTTFVPELTEKDIMDISSWVRGAKNYIIQQFRQPPSDGEVVDYRNLKTPHSPSLINELSLRVAENVCSYRTRGVV